jgi:hypothetical protein
MAQTYGDIRARFAHAMALYEAKAPTKEKQVYFDSYRKVVGLGEPKGTKSLEMIRAPFGADLDGTAEANIKSMYAAAGKTVSAIEYFAKGQVRQGKNLGSNDYASYKITSTDGTESWVTNSTVELDSGGNQEIGKKDLTPAKLGVSGIIFKDVNSLINVIEGNIKMYTSISEGTQQFLISLAHDVKNNSTAKYDNMKSYFDAGKSGETIKLSSNSNIDAKSLNNIVNDYGEILDGVYLLTVIKDIGSGLEFPAAQNEALSDLWVDGWNVSSKAAKGGGRPGIDAIVKACAIHANSGLDLALNESETELYNILLDMETIKKGGQLPAVEVYIQIANTLISTGKMKNSGFEHFLNTSGNSATKLTRKDILSFIMELAKDPEKYEDFMSTFWSKCGTVPTKPESPENIIKQKKGDEFYYPLAVEVVNNLNTWYRGDLATIINKLLVVKQMYLTIDLRNDLIKFLGTSSGTIPMAKFVARGSSSTFNAGLGYEMGK